MAQSREYWDELIDIEMSIYNPSNSAVAEWKLWKNVIISVVMVIDQIMDFFKTDVEAYVRQQRYGTKAWYKSMCYEFQYGDILQVTDGIVEYIPVNPSKQIVKAASVRDQVQDGLVVKIAKEVNGSLAPLSAAELSAFQSYFYARKILGTVATIYSNGPDSIFYEIQVEFDALFDEGKVQAEIQSALDNYSKNYPFDGLFYRADMIQQVMNVPGVVNMHYDNLEITHHSGVTEVITDTVELYSGYFNFDANSSITMIIVQ